MAEKRMFSKSIVCSDEFLEMPDSTQCLYFHLSMNADDDGFVDKPKAIVRMIGAKEDDLKVLLTKSFVLPFDTGVIVIRHWRLNNYIQRDRKKETIYQEELNCLRIDSSGAYTFGDGDLIGSTNKTTTPLTSAQQLRLDAKKESDLPYSFEYKIKAQFIGKECPICGKTMTTYSKKTQPTIQHNTPISKGGKHELGNISIICGECNYSIQDNETEELNSEEVIKVWRSIENENVSGMYTQNRIDKSRLDKNNILCENENELSLDVEVESGSMITAESQIFDFWNKCNIIKHRDMTDNIKKTITKSLKTYTREDICKYIKRYAIVLEDDKYFFNYKWTLIDFLNRKDGISSFSDEGSKWVNFVNATGYIEREEVVEEVSYEDKESF